METSASIEVRSPVRATALPQHFRHRNAPNDHGSLPADYRSTFALPQIYRALAKTVAILPDAFPSLAGGPFELLPSE
jgi:hypothetical protein